MNVGGICCVLSFRHWSLALGVILELPSLDLRNVVELLNFSYGETFAVTGPVSCHMGDCFVL